MTPARTPALAFALVAALAASAPGQEPAGGPAGEILIEPALLHLGNDVVKDWTDVGVDPVGADLVRAFEAAPRSDESLLFVTQQDIDHDWDIRVNGAVIGRLQKGKPRTERYYAVPGGTLRRGGNELVLRSEREGDDVVLGRVRLVPLSVREHFRLGRLTVRVTDLASGAPLPARVTLVGEGRSPKAPEVFYADETAAVRPGLGYTLDGLLDVEVPEGTYRVIATRGVEWSLAEGRVDVPLGGGAEVALGLAREVDTAGFVAADTHIHTLEHSGHGDASEVERLVTLAGEGVELAIATDHNHNIDYRPNQKRLRLSKAFTSVVGNEVTTKVGHFNAFPLDPKDEVPPHDLTDWVQIVDGIRAKGAKVVILNHPRWPEIETGPFGKFALDRASGEVADGAPPWRVDAIEVVNSGTLQPDPMYLLVDWFAMLNRGDRITAVGSSDSHAVGPAVGQGRTYVRSSTDDPGRIDVDEACRSFQRGRTSVSLGIFVDVKVNGKHGLGDVVRPGREPVRVALRVAAPSWVRPRVARVFGNGVELAKAELADAGGAPTDRVVEFELDPPKVDTWLVCVVVGDGVDTPAWPIEADYTLGVTNPVYLDADGGGSWLPPNLTAQRLLERARTAAQRVAAIEDHDDGVAVQIASLMIAAADADDLAALLDLRARLGDRRPLLRGYLERLSTAPAGTR